MRSNYTSLILPFEIDYALPTFDKSQSAYLVSLLYGIFKLNKRIWNVVHYCLCHSYDMIWYDAMHVDNTVTSQRRNKATNLFPHWLRPKWDPVNIVQVFSGKHCNYLNMTGIQVRIICIYCSRQACEEKMRTSWKISNVWHVTWLWWICVIRSWPADILM